MVRPFPAFSAFPVCSRLNSRRHRQGECPDIKASMRIYIATPIHVNTYTYILHLYIYTYIQIYMYHGYIDA